MLSLFGMLKFEVFSYLLNSFFLKTFKRVLLSWLFLHFSDWQPLDFWSFSLISALLSLIYYCFISEIICLKHTSSIGVYFSTFLVEKCLNFWSFWLILTVFPLKITAVVSSEAWLKRSDLSWQLAWLRWCALGLFVCFGWRASKRMMCFARSKIWQLSPSILWTFISTFIALQWMSAVQRSLSSVAFSALHSRTSPQRCSIAPFASPWHLHQFSLLNVRLCIWLLYKCLASRTFPSSSRCVSFQIILLGNNILIVT